MNRTAHQIAKGVMNHAVPGDTAVAEKNRRHDQQSIVSAAAAGPFVTGVSRRVVDQLATQRSENRQSLLDDRFPFRSSTGIVAITHAGSAFLNGLTLTAW